MTDDTDDKGLSLETLKKLAEKRSIGRLTRHIFLCAGPKCCDPEQGDAVWKFLKSKHSELTAAGVQWHRTRTTCLRFCQGGPLAVVYPEGTWYHSLNESNLDRVIQEHLLNGRIVRDLVVAEDSLGQ